MDKKKGSGGNRLEKFFAGKGFYIVLFLCVAIIGVSTVVLMNGAKDTTNVDYPADIASIENVSPTPRVTVTAPPTSASPEPTADTGAEAEPDTNADSAAEPETDTTEPTAPDIVQDTGNGTEGEAVWSEQPAELAAPSYYIWPVVGDVENSYSATTLVYNRTMADWRTHEGMDIACEIGTQVMAASGGTVESVFADDLYGTTVIIDHYGGLKSVYCNLAEAPTVYAGDNVSAGEIIGAVGDTALCETGEVTHLHFAMQLDGASVDPSEYLPAR